METAQDQPDVPVHENPHNWDVSGRPWPTRTLLEELVRTAALDHTGPDALPTIVHSNSWRRPRIVFQHARFFDFESAAWFATELRTLGLRVPEAQLRHGSNGANWIDFPLEGLPA